MPLTIAEIKEQLEEKKAEEQSAPAPAPKKRKPRKKKEPKQAPPPKEELITQAELDELAQKEIKEEDERNALISELTQLAQHNPGILDAKQSEIYDRIKRMGIPELRERLAMARIYVSQHLNNSLTTGVLHIVSGVIGKALGCVDELQDEVRNDTLLQSTCNQALGVALLTKMSDPVKIAGLLASDVVSAKLKSRQRAPAPAPVRQAEFAPVPSLVPQPPLREDEKKD